MQAAPDQKKTRPLAPREQASQTARLHVAWGDNVSARRATGQAHAGPDAARLPSRPMQARHFHSQASKAPDSMDADSWPHLRREAQHGFRAGSPVDRLRSCTASPAFMLAARQIKRHPPAREVAPQAKHDDRDDARPLQHPGDRAGARVWGGLAGGGGSHPLGTACSARFGQRNRSPLPPACLQAHLGGRVCHIETEEAGGQHRHAFRARLHAVPAEPPAWVGRGGGACGWSARHATFCCEPREPVLQPSLTSAGTPELCSWPGRRPGRRLPGARCRPGWRAAQTRPKGRAARGRRCPPESAGGQARGGQGRASSAADDGRWQEQRAATDSSRGGQAAGAGLLDIIWPCLFEDLEESDGCGVSRKWEAA